MAPLRSQEKEMAMRTSVIDRLCDGLNTLSPGLKALPGEREGAQHLPPWLDQVEVGSAFRLEHHLPARIRQHEQQPIGGAVAAQVVGNDADPLSLLRQPGVFDRLQEDHPVGSEWSRGRGAHSSFM
jgi:hypothetical protein